MCSRIGHHNEYDTPATCSLSIRLHSSLWPPLSPQSLVCLKEEEEEEVVHIHKQTKEIFFFSNFIGASMCMKTDERIPFSSFPFLSCSRVLLVPHINAWVTEVILKVVIMVMMLKLE